MSYSSKQEFIQKNWDKIEKLEEYFIGYYPRAVSASRIEQFLCQFELEHMPVALKLLENIEYYDPDADSQLVVLLGRIIKNEVNNSLNSVYFFPIDTSSGSSTDVVLRNLRNELGFDSDRYNHKFPPISDLRDWVLDTDHKKVVFVDDYAGSGNSFLKFWGRIGTLYNQNHRYYLGVLACSHEGKKNIESNSNVQVISVTNPNPKSEKIFDDDNTTFEKKEKEILKKYCRKVADSELMRYGFGNTQSSIIFHSRSSNNILPILWSRENDWFPLFPRTRF